jgi:NAD(P)-dependent dehydrogenase (short-subunit alcohol dehydrogenase family)
MIKDKIAIVTGAAQGIGKSIAQLFSQNGAIVILIDINEEKLRETASEIQKSSGIQTVYKIVDIAKKNDVVVVVKDVVSKFGRVDILVNNAGIYRNIPLLDIDEEDWDKVFAVNVKGTFFFTQEVGKVMVRQQSGKIINMSSCSGKKPDKGQAAYNSTKSAVIGLTRVTALELGEYGINCNAICPGATDTEMIRKTFLTSPEVEKHWIDKTALKRLGQPDDIAKVALFLASGLSDHITGEALIVSAGELMGQ